MNRNLFEKLFLIELSFIYVMISLVSVGANPNEGFQTSFELPYHINQIEKDTQIFNTIDSDSNRIIEVYDVDLDEDFIVDVRLYDCDENGYFEFAELTNGETYFIVVGKWEKFYVSHSKEEKKKISKSYKIRLVSSGELGAGPAFKVATFELQEVSTGNTRLITFTGVGLGAGLKGGASIMSSWCFFETKETMSLNDFESFGRITTASMSGGVGGGYTALSFYPTDKVWVYIECTGIELGLGGGISSVGGWWEIRD